MSAAAKGAMFKPFTMIPSPPDVASRGEDAGALATVSHLTTDVMVGAMYDVVTGPELAFHVELPGTPGCEIESVQMRPWPEPAAERQRMIVFGANTPQLDAAKAVGLAGGPYHAVTATAALGLLAKFRAVGPKPEPVISTRVPPAVFTAMMPDESVMPSAGSVVLS